MKFKIILDKGFFLEGVTLNQNDYNLIYKSFKRGEPIQFYLNNKLVVLNSNNVLAVMQEDTEEEAEQQPFSLSPTGSLKRNIEEKEPDEYTNNFMEED